MLTNSHCLLWSMDTQLLDSCVRRYAFMTRWRTPALHYGIFLSVVVCLLTMEMVLLFFLYRDMFPNSSTYLSVLNMCSFLGMLKPGQQTHGCALKGEAVNDLIPASVLIDFYSKCSLWADACQAFSEVRHYDTIVLNSMITVYSNCGQTELWILISILNVPYHYF